MPHHAPRDGVHCGATSAAAKNYTLVQVSVNDLILLVLFIPIVQLLLGITGIAIPWGVLGTSVIVFVVVPLVAAISPTAG